MKIAVSVLALLVAASAVQAADLVIEEPVVVEEASGIAGVVEFGAYAQNVDNTSDPFEGWAPGAYISGAISGGADSFVWGIDGYAEGANFETANEAPNWVGLLGGHLGFGFDGGTVGAFGSVGVVPDRDDFLRSGYTVGVEGMVDVSGVVLFGQLGWANVNTETPDTDPAAGFIGAFVRGGAVFSLSDDLAVMLDVGYGATDKFTEDGQEGKYWTAGIKGALALPTDFGMYLTAAYEYGNYDAIAQSDTAVTHTVKIGLSIPIGDTNTAAKALNPLATTAQPYRAGSYGSALD
jgi:hypothetical protein